MLRVLPGHERLCKDVAKPRMMLSAMDNAEPKRAATIASRRKLKRSIPLDAGRELGLERSVIIIGDPKQEETLVGTSSSI